MLRFARQDDDVGRQCNRKLETGVDQTYAAPSKMGVEEC